MAAGAVPGVRRWSPWHAGQGGRQPSGRLGVPPLLRVTGLLALVLLAAVPIMLGDRYWQRQTLLIALWSLPAISVMVLIGFSGELFIGQLAIFAIAAFTSAHLTEFDGWPFLASVIVGTILAGAAGVVLAVPALRLGQWRLAITSLFMVFVIPDLVDSDPWGLTGGAIGLPGVPDASLFGHTLGTEGLDVFVLCSLALVLVLARNLRRSSWGRCLAVTKVSGPAAESLGISLFRAKLMVYAFSALIAGYAGAVFPHIDGYVGAGSFQLSQSILVLAAAIIGGIGVLIGPVLGTALLMMIPLVISSSATYSVFIYGAILIIVTLLLPAGLVPTLLLAAQRLAVLGRARVAQPRKPVTQPASASATQVERTAWRPVQQPMTLRVDAVTKSFGGITALRDVTVEARPGQVTAVIGPNGSGKTTLLNVISGFYRPTRGSVTIDGTAVPGQRPHKIAAMGVARTFQTARLPPDETVLQITTAGLFRDRKVSVLAALLRLPRARRDEGRAATKSYDILSRLGIADQAEVLGGELSAGQQRVVEIARALATDSPILMIDEPAAGLVGAEIDQLAELILYLKELGHTVLIIDHHIELVMRVADRVVVLDFGTVIASGSPDQVRDDAKVIRAYLGSATERAGADINRDIHAARQERSHGDHDVLGPEKIKP